MKARTYLRGLAAIAVLLATVGLVVLYYAHHPKVWQQLTDTPLPLLAGLLALYICFVGSIALINSATFRLAGAEIGRNESALLTMYSSIINFFGPLQSGPAFRALYLKAKHGIKLRNYTAATFLYYLFYAAFSGLFLLGGVLGWWLLVLVVFVGAAWWWLLRKPLTIFKRLQSVAAQNWQYLALATLLQVTIQAIIYYVELQSIMPHVGFGQVVSYTGAANFALFVSITPGAIGFRESFLLFSKKLHHIPNSAIVVANTLDRAAYISLLILLAIGIFSSHANRRFKIK